MLNLTDSYRTPWIKCSLMNISPAVQPVKLVGKFMLPVLVVHCMYLSCFVTYLLGTPSTTREHRLSFSLVSKSAWLSGLEMILGSAVAFVLAHISFCRTRVYLLYERSQVVCLNEHQMVFRQKRIALSKFSVLLHDTTRSLAWSCQNWRCVCEA